MTTHTFIPSPAVTAVHTRKHDELAQVALTFDTTGGGTFLVWLDAEQIDRLLEAVIEGRALLHAPDDAVHQPRERSVPCRDCGQPTFEYHAVCDRCGPAACDRCAPNVDDVLPLAVSL